MEEAPQGTTACTYDANGNLVKQTQTGGRTTDYSYDKENRLTKATIQQAGSVTVESYTYDYAGNRTSKTINESNTTYYVNDVSASLTMVTAETDKGGKETAYYTRGDELLSMESSGRLSYYIYDGHGSVRFLTNEAGQITDRYVYDAYGNLLQKEGDTENDFLYTGEQYNANTELYYLRARYMDPSTGTFISMDSYQGSLYDPVSLHKYLYANANPVMYTDPSGYFGILVAGVGSMTSMEVMKTQYDAVMFRIGMKLLASVYSLHGHIIVETLCMTVFVSLIFEPNNLNSIIRWAQCFNLYAENDVVSEIPDDIEGENSKGKEGEGEKTGDNDEENTQDESEFDKNIGALDQLGKDLEKAHTRNKKNISEEEARIIDELCKEYGKSQHHDTDYYYKHPHWDMPHTHIGGRHIPFH